MKKRLISICLALLFTFAPASAAFSDITDTSLAQTVSILDALGIMQGMGNNQFSPDTTLTRAQFCKIAVTAMGVSDVSAYANYTIFPDVKHSHWAAAYINAAVRHPDLKDRAIIRGYADGTFGPDKTVSFGEACTMLLRMLGYSEEDVGPFWPADYIAKAQSLGLTDGVSVSNASDAVKRSDAAIMLVNTLNAPCKDSETTLLDGLVSSTTENCILLATSDTNDSLAANEALIYDTESASISSRRTAGTLDSSLIGMYGTLVVKNGAVIGIMPSGNETESCIVTRVTSSEIQTSTQTLLVPAGTRVFLDRNGSEIGTFREIWSDIQPGDPLMIYYDAYGAIDLIAVVSGQAAGAALSFVYGTENAAEIPQDYRIMKNGAEISTGSLEKYDVVTLDAENKQALVCDAKISGQYTAASPSASSPSSVTVCGQTYTIPRSASASFAALGLNDYITLLFNASGDVVAAYPKTTVSADMKGVVTAVQDKHVTVLLDNGLTLTDLVVEASDLSDLLGCEVTVGQSSNGAIFLTRTDRAA